MKAYNEIAVALLILMFAAHAFTILNLILITINDRKNTEEFYALAIKFLKISICSFSVHLIAAIFGFFIIRRGDIYITFVVSSMCAFAHFICLFAVYFIRNKDRLYFNQSVKNGMVTLLGTAWTIFLLLYFAYEGLRSRPTPNATHTAIHSTVKDARQVTITNF